MKFAVLQGLHIAIGKLGSGPADPWLPIFFYQLFCGPFSNTDIGGGIVLRIANSQKSIKCQSEIVWKSIPVNPVAECRKRHVRRPGSQGGWVEFKRRVIVHISRARQETLVEQDAAQIVQPINRLAIIKFFRVD
ncbi:hypothetical protein [Roseibium sp.]|uniref:hypothetical protein n=1 Tax=Roseibium sp. TaxID=1936156 RepID=UPI003265C36F